MVPLSKGGLELVIFASPISPRTWTAFVLDVKGCMAELKNLNGTDWPVQTGAEDDINLAR